jgi:radical SAM protein with 4Fe4S-binding SPASM domain
VLSQFRPLNIEITLYGATEATYEKITGAQGSYRQCLRGIEKILAHQLPLSLKTMLLTLNLNEFAAMKQMAKSFGLNFRYDYLVQPGCDRCKDPLALRISAEVAAALDFSDAKKKQNAKEMFAQDQGKIAADKIYNCGMGMHNFHIDPYGYLMGCIVAKHYKYDLLAGSFNQAWNNFFTPIHEKKVTSTYKCASCAISSLCLPCPGFRYLENGTELESCDYLCKIAQQKNKILSEECT